MPSVRLLDPWFGPYSERLFQSLFQEKDYLDGRFFHKRAYYLAVIAKIIQEESSLDAEVLFGTTGDDIRLTCLHVRPRHGRSLPPRANLYLSHLYKNLAWKKAMQRFG